MIVRVDFLSDFGHFVHHTLCSVVFPQKFSLLANLKQKFVNPCVRRKLCAVEVIWDLSRGQKLLHRSSHDVLKLVEGWLPDHPSVLELCWGLEFRESSVRVKHDHHKLCLEQIV